MLFFNTKQQSQPYALHELTQRMNEENKPEVFIGKTEVARRLGKTVRTVDSWMRRGILPYYKPDRCVLFRWQDVEEHIVRNYRVRRPGSQTTNPSTKHLVC